jgi:hypothetical protein
MAARDALPRFAFNRAEPGKLVFTGALLGKAVLARHLPEFTGGVITG